MSTHCWRRNKEPMSVGGGCTKCCKFSTTDPTPEASFFFFYNRSFNFLLLLHPKLPSSSTIVLLLQSKLPSSSIINNKYVTHCGSSPLFFHKDDMKHNLHYNVVVVVVPMSILLVVWKPMVCVDILFVSLGISLVE